MTNRERRRDPQASPGNSKDRPWLFRTYSGHTSAAASNALFRTNLARGQTGLSIAFDLPTQLGYDSDHPMAAGEVGKVGVPVCHIGDMRTLFDGIPLERMNTSMTINGPASWLLAMYVAVAEEQGARRAGLAGTVQNDIIKEYLSRGTYIFPPAPSLRLAADVISFTAREIPKWNPVNVCSYHLQEAGATPVEELAFALAIAIAVLDAVKASAQVDEADFPKLVGRLSFFVNAGMRFVTELCKMRAFTELWDEITRQRYGIEEPKLRRFRYGVQVNSLGLTEHQPENNVYRILLEMMAVVLSKNARARAVQLPAWNEALGLPRPWDQQWSLRLQQIVAYETDLLEYGDLFDGSGAVEAKVEELKDAARIELARIEAMGGAAAAVETAYMKQRLVDSNARRVAAIETGEQVVVGVNHFTETAQSPLASQDGGGILKVDDNAGADQIERVKAWRASRDQAAVDRALAGLCAAASEGRNIMEPTIAAARAGVTTGEWGRALRDIFGEYRAPTGIGGGAQSRGDGFEAVRKDVEALTEKLGRRPKILVGKPGLDGHSNGAEQIALAARDSGFEVVYDGIHSTPGQIANAALEEDVHLIGLSILSGGHAALVGEVLGELDKIGRAGVPVIVGGIIPPEDRDALLAQGVARIFTPKDYKIAEIMGEIVELISGVA
ncbi:MAG: methylmalonyl-CoA mutase family protein [Sphingomonadales bacterium]